MSSLDEFRSSDTSRRLCAGLAEPDDGNSPAFPLVRAYVEPPAGIEPATHPYHRCAGGSQRPCNTSRAHATAQVGGPATPRLVRRGEARRGEAWFLANLWPAMRPFAY
jgi:hypothetical protein